jgi:preprotein translocase subunit SecF
MNSQALKPIEKVIHFMAWRRSATWLSVICIVVSVLAMIFNGLNYSMEFLGGTALEYRFSENVSVDKLQKVLANAGIDKATVAYLGSEREVIVRTPPLADAEFDRILAAIRLAEADKTVELRASDKIGPQVAGELRDHAVYAVLVSLALLLIYISFRFQFKFAVGAIAALMHDVIIVVGIFAMMKWEFSLNVFAAVLTVIGYSLNDTIVIFDRIRENLKRLRGQDPLTVINISLTQTLERTLITVLTTLIVVLALFFFGGEVIHGFATALIIGLVVGTYSSIYIASNILLKLKVSRLDLLTPIEREDMQAQ